MSKIYKALEKAERERTKGLIKDQPTIPGANKEKIEIQEIKHKPREMDGKIFDPQLVSLYESGSLAAEQFRKLRTFLLRLRIHDAPKTIMVTSAMSNEGKTFVATNLAIGIAHELQSHAVLVDCDLRNPALLQWFGLQNDKGLSDYLMGNGEISGLLKKTKVEKLSILGGGSVRDNPTELLGSKKMEALVLELKSRYPDRYVIFDSTPLLATTEPQVLEKVVDGIIIVVRAGVTPRETVKQAIAPLEKEKVFGFVLNYLEFKYSALSSRYFGSDGYYYRYGYGKSLNEPQKRWTKPFRFIKKFG